MAVHRLAAASLVGLVRAGAPLLVAASLTAQLPAAPPREASAIAITRVTEIDVAAGRRVPNQTVIVRGRHIVAVGPSGRTPVPPDARVVDGRGRYLIPGLWDMHVHLSAAGSDRSRVPRLLAHGVTGARAMSQECLGDCATDPFTLDSVRAWRAASARGERLVPRLIASGPRSTGPSPRARGPSAPPPRKTARRACA